MGEKEVRKAEAIVLKALARSNTPLSPSELASRRPARSDVSAVAVHRAMWNLVDEGKIKFTEDRRLVTNSAR